MSSVTKRNVPDMNKSYQAARKSLGYHPPMVGSGSNASLTKEKKAKGMKRPARKS